MPPPALPPPVIPPPAIPSPAAHPGPRAAAVAELRSRIRRLEGLGGAGEGRALPLGVAALDAALPDGGLPLACLHEVAAADPGAATAFVAALLARLLAVRTHAPVVWIVRGRDLHAPGLAAYGLGPDRLIAVRARRDAEALWAMEEALRCPALAAVLGEVGTADLTASRRLQLAAEAGGVTGLLLPRDARPAASAAVTRWRVAAAPSGRGVVGVGGGSGARAVAEPGVGAPRWRADLLRCRGGRPGAWVLEWRDGALAQVPDGAVVRADGAAAGGRVARRA